MKTISFILFFFVVGLAAIVVAIMYLHGWVQTAVLAGVSPAFAILSFATMLVNEEDIRT